MGWEVVIIYLNEGESWEMHQFYVRLEEFPDHERKSKQSFIKSECLQQTGHDSVSKHDVLEFQSITK